MSEDIIPDHPPRNEWATLGRAVVRTFPDLVEELEVRAKERVLGCEAVGGTVSEHRCEDCESCLIRKRTVEADVLFYECPGCGWVTTEILR